MSEVSTISAAAVRPLIPGGSSQRAERAERADRAGVGVAERPGAQRAGDRFEPSERGGASAAGAGGEESADAAGSSAGVGRGTDGEPLTAEEQEQVDKLQARDREVRAHEQAHKNVAGPYAVSGPTYSYQRGPDGQRYAVGGSVQIDTSPEDTPEQTLAKMQQVRRAALAPAEPSAQDRRVAQQASQQAAEARAEINAQRAVESEAESEEGEGGKTGAVGSVDEPKRGKAGPGTLKLGGDAAIGGLLDAIA
ncbi:MAG: putative metalloprotease CJM1_0395 family protein [Planctomycetota bacterium]